MSGFLVCFGKKMTNNIEEINSELFRKYSVRPNQENINRITNLADKINSGEKPIVKVEKLYGALDGINPVELTEIINKESKELISAYLLAKKDIHVQYSEHNLEPEFIDIKKLYDDNPGQLYVASDFLVGIDNGVDREKIEELVDIIDSGKGVIPYLLVAEQPDGKYIIDDNRLDIFYAFVITESKEIPCIVIEKDLTPSYIKKQQRKKLKLN